MPDTQPASPEPQPHGPVDDGTAAHLPPPPFTVRDIFVGAEGLRAGWSLLLFAAVFLALLNAAIFLRHQPQDQRASHPISLTAPVPPRFLLVQESVPLVCVFLATLLMARIERRPLAGYGFRPRRAVRNFCTGLVSGAALLSLLVVLLRARGLLVFDARLLHGTGILRYGAIWLAGFLLVGLLEEGLTRGFPQFTLARGLSAIYRRLFGARHANALGFWTAAAILSFAFGFVHRTNPGESPLGLLSAGLAGIFFCFSLWRTGSLWWAIGFHATWDWSQSFLYGVADSGILARDRLFGTHPVGPPYLSGGLTGPEGSLLLYPVLLVGIALVLFTLPRTHAGYQPAGTAEASLHPGEASLH